MLIRVIQLKPAILILALFILPFSASVADTDQATSMKCVPFEISVVDDDEYCLGHVLGQPAMVDLVLSSSEKLPAVYGFNLLISYPNEGLFLTDVRPGEYYYQCDFEYFSYNAMAHPSIDTLGLVRISAFADEQMHKSSSLHDLVPGDSVSLAEIEFLATNDRLYECTLAPVEFYWLDCSDNVLWSHDYRRVYAESDVYRSCGHTPVSPLADSLQMPGPGGVPDSCLAILGDQDEKTADRRIKFTSGGVQFICSDCIRTPDRDCMWFEPEDVTYMARMFLNTLGNLTPFHCIYHMGTEVDRHEPAFTLGDLYCLIMMTPFAQTPDVVTQGMPPTDYDIYLDTESEHGQATLSSEGEFTAALVVVEGDFVPLSVNDENLFYRRFDGKQTRMLFTADSVSWDMEPSQLAGSPLFTFRGRAPEVTHIEVVNANGQFVPVEFAVPPQDSSSYTIRIESVMGEDGEGVQQGQPVDLQIFADNLGDRGISGFDLTIQIDVTCLTLISIDPGDLLNECEWEYFTYQYGTGYVPIYGIYRILATADLHNEPSRPICTVPEDGYPVSLANFKFLVTNDQTFAGFFAPVRFVWYECTSNTLSAGHSHVDVLYDKRVFDDTLEITDHTGGLPTWYGTPDSCLPEIRNEHRRLHKIRRVDFYNGGVQIVAPEPYEYIGDINANGIPYEIADAVMFANYLIQGLSAFGGHIDHSIMASDVNENGITLELTDLQFLIRIVVGDAEPYPGPVNWTSQLSVDENTGGLTFNSPGDIQALHVVVSGEFIPMQINGENSLEYAFDGSNTRLLFLGASLYDDPQNSPLAGPVLVGAGNFVPEILSAEATTYYGQAVEVVIDPTPEEPTPYRVSIELEDGDGLGAYQGQFTEVSVSLDEYDMEEGLGGFDFLFTYDPVGLSFHQAASGQLYDECGWEYFTFRVGSDGVCEDCPAGLIRVVGVAETNNGPYHPTCDVDTAPVDLFDLVFLVTNDRTFECRFLPINFFWIDCGDNSITNTEGTELYLNASIYDLVTEEDISDGQAGFPGFFGARDECLLEALPGRPLPTRQIDFRSGGVQIMCAGYIDARGDINLNGIACEIADVVMFWNYFEHGLSAFATHVDGSVATSDVNHNGVPLELSDFFYLRAIVIGDAPSSEPVTPTPWHMQVWTDNGSNTVRFSAPGDIVGLLLVIEGDFTPTWSNEIDNQYLRYFDGANTRMLFVGNEFEIGGVTDVLTGGAIFGFSGSEPEILYVEAVTHYGQPVSLEVGVPLDADNDSDLVPTAFALHQNYPNPFNPETQIAYDLPAPSEVTLEIYNVMGQRVRTLHEGTQSAGEHLLLWNGADDSGNPVASGIYLYRLTAGTQTATRKMLLLK